MTRLILSLQTGPADAADLRPRVQATIDDVLADGAPVATSARIWNPRLRVADLLAGGKRLRPAFAYWGWQGATADVTWVPPRSRPSFTPSPVWNSRACPHHDDVMDGQIPRGPAGGSPTFRRVHRNEQWLGSPVLRGGSSHSARRPVLSWADEVLLTSILIAMR